MLVDAQSLCIIPRQHAGRAAGAKQASDGIDAQRATIAIITSALFLPTCTVYAPMSSITESVSMALDRCDNDHAGMNCRVRHSSERSIDASQQSVPVTRAAPHLCCR